jgi:hypothetical protein
MGEPIIMNEPEPIAVDKMQQLVTMVARARELESTMEQLDEQMSNMNKELQDILGGWQSPGQLVTLLQTAGPVPVSEITLEDGTHIAIHEEVKPPSMGAGSKHRELIVDWAKVSGYAGVIKNEVTINVPVGKDSLADEILKQAEASGLQGKKFATINAQTLAALLRELIEDGADVPLDQLGIYVFRKAKITTKAR